MSVDSDCIHRWFERQVGPRGDAVAVICGTDRLTYRDLDRRANRLAHRLRGLGVGPETPVAVCVRRSTHLVTALLAVLKAGGCYLPLDPAHPADRLAAMIADAGATVLVGDGSVELHAEHTVDPDVGDGPDTPLAGVGLGSDMPLAGAGLGSDAPFAGVGLGSDAPLTGVGLRSDAPLAGAGLGPDMPLAVDGSDTPPVVDGLGSDNLAYLMYTSGSTGRPKGVMVEHRNVIGLLTATRDLFGFGPGDVWTMFASAAFDVSVWEMWGALLHGGTLVVVPDRVKRSPEEFRDLLREQNVTVLNQTPSAFGQLVDLDTTGLSLRVVVFAGEELKFESLRPWFDRHGDREPLLVNMYGITETTVHSTFRVVTAADLDTAPGSMIGGALPGQSITLVDREIHVGGSGVTRGYLGRPGLTAERYLPDPDRPGMRVYRSGDTASAVGDDLRYTGRLDHQVKIRGHRIELGEVETALRGHTGVQDVVVTAAPDPAGDRRLIAYWVGETAPDLRDHLKRTLPEYMVPAAFVRLDRFPLTPNGKVDRQALPDPDNARPDLAAPFAAPSTELERAIAAIWAEALWVDEIGLDDDFFDLGGQSLLATQVAATMRERLGVAASLRLLLDEPTIRLCAKALERRS